MLDSKIVKTGKTTRWQSLAGWVGLGACAAIFPWVVMGPLNAYVEGPRSRLLVFALLAVLGAICLRLLMRSPAWQGMRTYVVWELALAGAVVVIAAVYRAAAHLPEISTYPLSMGWSEASRYYYASLYLSDWIYGVHVPPSVLHPTRYLMQAVPFLIPGLPLVAHRIWQVLLWLAFNLAAAGLLARRLSFTDSLQKGLFILWGVLFLYQGPVYYHLLVMMIVVLWSFDRRRFGWSLAWVLAASIWGGVSRINWVPVPGMLAAMLYFLEEPASKPAWRTLVKPAAWTILGTLAGLASQQAYVMFSGNPPEVFGSSFTSDLLWYRLFPSETYPMGVLRAVALASVPLVLLIVYRLVQTWRRVHWLRWLGLVGIVGVLLAGGVVVSAKIGGGSNLHNVDAYLALLLVLGGYLLTGQIAPDRQATLAPDLTRRWVPGLALLLAGVPAWFTITSGGALPVRDFARAEAEVGQIRQMASEYATQGEVLFISERHLLALGEIQSVALVPEGEKVFLMEMAMANNRPYLETFYQDLESHRFALIVSHPMRIVYQGMTHEFGEENDAWVSRVTEPVLCYYEPLPELTGGIVQFLVPKEGPVDCSFTGGD